MNFLSKTFSTLTGSSIPYTIGDKLNSSGGIGGGDSIWTIYKGSNPKQDNAEVTIFEFNLRDPENINRGYVELARNCFKKLKLIKHPGIISIIDFIENDNFLYMITEPVVTLLAYLRDNRENITPDIKLFGIHSLAHTISFLNKSCNYLHGNLNIFNSIYISRGGDWKLFGFDLLTNLSSDPEQPFYRFSSYVDCFDQSLPPDIKTGGLDSVRNFPDKFDAYKFAVIIYLIFKLDKLDNLSLDLTQNQLVAIGNVLPPKLLAAYKRLLSPKPNLRLSIDTFLSETETFFESNPLISFIKQLQELKFKNDSDKLSFFKNDLATFTNEDSDTKFPPGLLDNTILPELLYQFNNISNLKPTVNSMPGDHQRKQETISILLNYILRFGSTLPQQQFDKLIKPVIFNTFPMADRSIRLALLTYISNYAQLLTESEVQLKIFYNLITGLQDTNFMIRETTLKSITTIIDKVSVKQVNQDLLKILAKSQMDPKPSIRVNTLILIIKISDKIYNTSRNNVLITALSKSLRDSFTPCKMSALSGFESLIKNFSLDEICGKILGHVAISLMDPKSSKVRKEARRIFNMYLETVEEFASSLPEGEDNEEDEEREFMRKVSPVNPVESENKTSEDSVSFGWNVVNKLVSTSGISGKLNSEFSSSTPDLTRVATPTSDPLKINNAQTISKNTWKDDLIVADDENDGWDIENDEEVVEEDIRKPLTKISKLLISKEQKNGNLSSKTKKSSLHLGSKHQTKKVSSKLNLVIEDDAGDDGWDETVDW